MVRVLVKLVFPAKLGGAPGDAPLGEGEGNVRIGVMAQT